MSLISTLEVSLETPLQAKPYATNVSARYCPAAAQSSRSDVVGKTLAYTSVKFVNKDGEIVARGSHTKFVAIAHKDPKNITDELKPDVPESKVFKGHVFKE